MEGFEPLFASAVSLHEWFITLQEGGFTEDQAIKLIAFTISNLGKDTEG
jgi:hypothetical protein